MLFVGRPAGRSVQSEEAGREESAPKSQLPMPTPFEVRKAAFGNDPYWRGCAGIGGVSSPGHIFTAGGQEPRTTFHLPLSGRTASARSRVRAAAGNRRGTGGCRVIVRTIVPVKVGNRRAPARGGHGTHWKEGGTGTRICRKGTWQDLEPTRIMSTDINRIATSAKEDPARKFYPIAHLINEERLRMLQSQRWSGGSRRSTVPSPLLF